MQIQVNTSIGRIFVDEIDGCVTISLAMNKRNLDKVVVCAENAGISGIIGPDIDVNIGKVVDEICWIAEEQAFSPK